MTAAHTPPSPGIRWSPARLGRRLLLTAFAMLLATPVSADVRARVEPRVIDELETTRLILRADGATTQTLDLQPLSADFEVLGTQTASQYRSVGGVVEAWVEYQITLRPKRAGALQIPALAVGSATSQPLDLEVRGVDPALRSAIDRMVFFELELTRNPVYVRGETVLIRRLLYSSATQIYSDLPGLPEIPRALVMQIGETQSSMADRNGERYGVIEQRFAIFPEQTGLLTIPPISLTSSVRLQAEGRIRRSGVRVSSEPLTLEVLPIPAQYPLDQPWLPATDLILRDAWQPDLSSIPIGDPITRQVEIRVVGNLAAAIPPPADGLPAQLRQYPEPAILNDDRGGPSLVGSRRTDYAIVPTVAGAVTVPALSITWWDVDAERVRTSSTSVRRLSLEAVAGDATGEPRADPVAGPASDETTDGAQTADAATDRPDAGSSAEDTKSETRRQLWAIAGGLAALMLIAIWLFPGLGRALGRAIVNVWHGLKTVGARFPLYHLIADRLAHRRRRREIARQCRNRDPAAVQAALMTYLCGWYRTSPAIAQQRFRQAGYGDLLDQLNAARFRQPSAAQHDGGKPAHKVDSRRLLTALRALERPASAQSEALPGLFDAR